MGQGSLVMLNQYGQTAPYKSTGPSKKVSVEKLGALCQKLEGDDYYGKVVLIFQKGKIYHVQMIQDFKSDGVDHLLAK